MSDMLLIMALGPVQEFIAASRKARDLWRGSSLLSEVSAAAASAVRDYPKTHADTNVEVDLIFPAPEALQNGLAAPGALPVEPNGIANKLLAQVSGDDAAAMCEKIAAVARAAAASHLRKQWDEIWSRLSQGNTGLNGHVTHIDVPLAERQIEQFLEFYAAWYPVGSGVEAYREARERIERLLAGRKTLRNFLPAAAAIGGRAKSSLDPARDSIIHIGLRPEEQSTVSSRLHLSGSEQLDAVSVIKRLGSDRRIISTSRVALDPFFRLVEPLPETEGTSASAPAGNPAAKARLEELRKLADALAETDLVEPFSVVKGRHGLSQFRQFPYDCQLFFEEPGSGHLQKMIVEAGLAPVQAGHVNDFVNVSRKVRNEAGFKGELPTSYAIVVADGDNMGKAIGDIHDAKKHVQFSEMLLTFADTADEIVQSHSGALLYSGGDDVVAFFPTDTVIPCVKALADAFAAIMKEAKDRFGLDVQPTLSAGVAIVHFREHLQVAMRWARDAEAAAKKHEGKNALAVHLHTRSGGAEALKVVHSWKDEPLREVWARWIQLHLDEAIPDAAAYELRTLHREFNGVQLPPEDLRNLLGAEALRILSRKRGKQGTENVDTETVNHLVERIGGNLNNLRSVTDELLIARRLARAVDIVGGVDHKKWSGLLVKPQKDAGTAEVQPDANGGEQQ